LEDGTLGRGIFYCAKAESEALEIEFSDDNEEEIQQLLLGQE
jgi:hypothetical protein